MNKIKLYFFFIFGQSAQTLNNFTNQKNFISKLFDKNLETKTDLKFSDGKKNENSSKLPSKIFSTASKNSFEENSPFWDFCLE